METKILFNGTHNDFEKDGLKYIDDITSSVTLVKAEGENILIDTGSPIYESKLIVALKEIYIKPEEISWIIETHLHPDHVGNNHLFKNAKIVEGNWVIDFKNSLYTAYKKNVEVPLPKGIKIINVPGHTLPHFAVILEEKDKKIVFSGDAIQEAMLEESYSPDGQDVTKMIESALKICDIADEIIPGHGPVLKRNEIEKIKNNLLKTK